MLQKLKTSRYYQILLFFLVLMVILMVRLFVITVFENERWQKEADALSTKSIESVAARGNIYDRDGKLLAGSKQTFNVKISDTGLNNEELNKVASSLLELFKANKDSYRDNFPIVVSSKGKFSFTFQTRKKEWLKEQNLDKDTEAEEAFNKIRSDLGIDENLDKYDAQIEMQEKHGVYPPISVGDTITYTYDNEQKSFLEKYHIDEEKTGEMTAEDAFGEIREYFDLDDDLSPKEAREIMVIRDAIVDLGYKKYLPATIAKDVSDKSIVAIEENPNKYKGVSVVTESERYYPQGHTASHILGYIGSIPASEYKEYEKKGYSSEQFIGQTGIEASFEEDLKGTNGSTEVQVDALGNLSKVLDEKEPVKGKDIELTIDLDLQKVAEDALKREIYCCRTGRSFKSKYGNYSPTKASRCRTGAVVAMDVKTGDVLAMASYPDYDPNLFTSGISSKDWNSLQSENPRNSLSPQPLYNIATRTAVQPGSTFKMVTATMALEKGLDPYKSLYDQGYVDIGDTRFGCVLYTLGGGRHGSLNMIRAIAVSCNVYFFDIASGKDYYTGASLGYRGGAKELLKYAKEYGLGQSTGIELTETETALPSEQTKINGVKTSITGYLWNNALRYFEKDDLKDEAKLTADIDNIASWTEEDPSVKEITKRLADNGIRESRRAALASMLKYSFYAQAAWSEGDTLNLSIGQGENAYTPLQLCSYISTIGNKGVKNKVSIVKKIGDKKNSKPKGKRIDISEDFSYRPIMRGLIADTQTAEGSLYNVFHDFPVTVAGKTGTAEKAGKVNPRDEVKYVREHLTSITSVPWEKIEKEMKRIMKLYPNTYTSEDVAVRQALMNLDSSVTAARIDRFKSKYDNFAWVVTLAPAKNPKIAVAVLLAQGKASLNAAPVAREVIGSYLNVKGTKGKRDSKEQQ